MGRGNSTPSLDVLTDALASVVKSGIRLTDLRNGSLVALLCNDSKSTDEFAVIVEYGLRQALNRLGDGRYGTAAKLLFGAEVDSRGLLLKDRRRLAAKELDLLPSTFRETYEHRIVEDVAAELFILLITKSAVP